MASFPFVIKRMSLRASAAVSVRQDIRVMLDFVSPLSATPREGFRRIADQNRRAARPRAGDPITRRRPYRSDRQRSTGVLVTASTIQILAGDPRRRPQPQPRVPIATNNNRAQNRPFPASTRGRHRRRRDSVGQSGVHRTVTVIETLIRDDRLPVASEECLSASNRIRRRRARRCPQCRTRRSGRGNVRGVASAWRVERKLPGSPMPLRQEASRRSERKEGRPAPTTVGRCPR